MSTFLILKSILNQRHFIQTKHASELLAEKRKLYCIFHHPARPDRFVHGSKYLDTAHPIVVMKLLVKESSEKRSSRQDLPTPLSPISRSLIR